MQEVSGAAHDLHQLQEALALAAAPGPATPIRASPSHDSPALQQQAVNVAEPTAHPAASPAGSAEAPASGQPEGSLALEQAPAPETTAQVDAQEEPAGEAVSLAAAEDSTARNDKRVDPEDKPAPAMASMPAIKLDEQLKNSLAGSLIIGNASNEPPNPLQEDEPRSVTPDVSSQAGAVSGSPVGACNSPQGVKESDSPVTPMEGTSPARAPTAGADITIEARSTMIDKAAAEATTGVPPAFDCASQPVTPATTESTPPELRNTAAAPSVPLADASLESEEEEAGHAAEADAAVVGQGKGIETRPSATIREAQPNAKRRGQGCTKQLLSP